MIHNFYSTITNIIDTFSEPTEKIHTVHKFLQQDKAREQVLLEKGHMRYS